MARQAADPWLQEFEESMKLADDIMARIQERKDAGGSSNSRDSARLASATRRKVSMLNTKVDRLEQLLREASGKGRVSEKEVYRRQDMVLGIKYRAKMMSGMLSAAGQAADRGALLPPGSGKAPSETDRTAELDNKGIVDMQRQVMREQDDELETLGRAVTSTKHIALAVNEELDLHKRLLDDIDEDLSHTQSRMKNVQARLSRFSKASSKNCSMLCLFMVVIGLVIVVLVMMDIIKYF